MLEVGATAQVRIAVTDSTGAPSDAGTVTCDVTAPDGSSLTGDVIPGATGSYSATFVASMAGRYLVRWSATRSDLGFPYSDSVDVWPADPRMIIGLSEARAALNLPSSVTVNDDEIRLHIVAATPIIEDLAGPVLRDSRTYRTTADYDAILLPEYAETVTSVVEDGVTVDPSGYWLDDAGIVWRVAGAWTSTRGGVTVTYTVGDSTPDASVIVATRELVSYLYQSSQQGRRPSFGANDAGTFTPSGFAVPRRVVELLEHCLGNVPAGVA